ncbi:MAG: efflux RND transporter periplasmic adaptor subunit [Thermoguttaceae bacterium]
MSSAAQFTAAIVITAGVLACLLFWPAGHGSEGATPSVQEVEIVKLIGRHQLSIAPGTPLEKKLAVAAVEREKTSAPMLKVTGSIVARLPPGKENELAEGRWDFNAPDLSSAYADWIKARADVPFNEKQLVTIREFSAATLKAKKDVADRLEKLVQAGTDPVKDLAAAKADYIQAKIQGQKDEHEAETAVKNAKRTLATLERQLYQAGIDPELLGKATESTAIVVAEVPEVRVGLAQPGQACVARFYAFPDVRFTGRVGSLAPTLSKERRTLRVFFQVSDPEGRLKPGMFAEIGLGTDARQSLMIPAEGVLHVGRSDYAIVADEAGTWTITEVKTGEQYGDRIEVLQGLKSGDRVVGAGAILLKPYVVRDIQGVAVPAAKPAADAEKASPGSAGS